ncbi:hypothetical protein FRC00_008772 [Tulasnella sp. 408]|nr:hypothetical protein FRC00_008772 [Tulasnella sp. 408]
MPKLAVRLDTSPETLRSRAPASGTPKPPTPHSRWSPATAEDTPLSPVGRLRRTISNAVSPILNRNRQSLQSPQPIPLQTIVTDVANSASRLLPNPTISPLDRFRHAVFKVMQMNKLKRAMISMHDPGMDASNAATSKVLLNARHEDCVIDVLDYGIAHAKSTRLTNADLGAFLAQPYRSSAKHVRWINVSGTSWDVIGQLARQYAIEDIYGGEKIARSKVDYYPQHIFLRLLCHLPRRQGKNSRRDIFISPGLHRREGTFTSDILGALSDDSDNEECRRPPLKAVKTLASAGLVGAQILGDTPKTQQAWAQDVYPEVGPIDIGKERMRLRQWFSALSPDERERTANTALVEALKRGRRVHITKQHVFVFLRRDGTVISFHGSRLYGLFEPIERRLKKSRSTLRLRPDASMLLHALIDHGAESHTARTVVHRSMDLIDDFHEQVLEFEKDILINPNKISVMRDFTEQAEYWFGD